LDLPSSPPRGQCLDDEEQEEGDHAKEGVAMAGQVDLEEGLSVEQPLSPLKRRLTVASSSSIGSRTVFCWVLVFKIGDPKKTCEVFDAVKKEQGLMSQREYFAIETNRLLRDLHRETGIAYKIYMSCPRLNKSTKEYQSEYIFALLGQDCADCCKWADMRGTDLRLEAESAVNAGREIGFLLAKRTRNAVGSFQESDESPFSPLAPCCRCGQKGDDDDPGANDPPANEAGESDELLAERKRCPISMKKWEHVHVEYRHSIGQKKPEIYQKYLMHPDHPDWGVSLFNFKLRCKLMYEMITSDKALGGGGVPVNNLAYDKTHPLCALYPLHNPTVLEHMEETWLKNWSFRALIEPPLDEIQEYFNEPIAFYFGFMQHYIRWLAYIFLPMMIAQIISIIRGPSYHGAEVPVLIVIIWSVCFVDFWKRQEHDLAVRWGLTNIQKKEVARPTFSGTMKISAITGEVELYYPRSWYILRVFAGFAGVFFMISLVLMIVASIFILRSFLRRRGPRTCLEEDPLGNCLIYDCLETADGPTCPEGYVLQLDYRIALGLGMVNAVQIAIFDAVFKNIAHILNEWENHKTHESFDNAITIKYFAFRFVNAFGSLFYLAYLSEAVEPTGLSQQQILEMLRLQLAALFITALVLQNFTELFLPRILNWFCSLFEAKRLVYDNVDEEIQTGGEVERQYGLEVYPSTLEDMAEIIIQYGYVTLFVICFPAIPLLAFFNNIVEIKIDGYKLVKNAQRPIPRAASGLGTWVPILEFFSVVSVLNNAALFVFVSDGPKHWFEKVDKELKVKLFFCVAVALFLMVGVFKFCIPDTTNGSLRHLARTRAIEEILVKEQNPPDDGFDPADILDSERCLCGMFVYNAHYGCIPWLFVKPKKARKIVFDRETLECDVLEAGDRLDPKLERALTAFDLAEQERAEKIAAEEAVEDRHWTQFLQ